MTSSRLSRAPALALFTGALAAAASLTPIWAAEPDRASGLLLLLGVGAELVHSFRRKAASAQHSAWASAGFTLLLALVLLNTEWLAATAVAVFIAGPFLLDAARHARAATGLAITRKPFLNDAGAAFGNLLVAAGVVLLGRFVPTWIMGLAAGVRLASV